MISVIDFRIGHGASSHLSMLVQPRSQSLWKEIESRGFRLNNVRTLEEEKKIRENTRCSSRRQEYLLAFQIYTEYHNYPPKVLQAVL